MTTASPTTSSPSRLGRLARVALAAGVLSALPIAALISPADAMSVDTSSTAASINPQIDTVPPVIVIDTIPPETIPPCVGDCNPPDTVPDPGDPCREDCTPPETVPDPCVNIHACPTDDDPPGHATPNPLPPVVVDPPVVGHPTFTG